GGANNANHLVEIHDLPYPVMQKQQAFSQRLAAAYAEEGLPYVERNQVVLSDGSVPYPSFNLTSAIHHVCGGMSMTFESNMGLAA
ncbi:hypothetical protein, partial [Lysinibacillus sp. GbtcB16]|uniref:hypothetical protein n=1 Tax=Lysinibacillus sp. GbtcB16 TaxID=2824761 RepID=UPI001C3041AA